MRDNQTQTQTQTKPEGARGGVARGNIRVTPSVPPQEQPDWSDRLSREFEFVRKHLPDEHTGFAVVALVAIKVTGRKPTRDRIYARLRESGRTREQLEEKGWM